MRLCLEALVARMLPRLPDMNCGGNLRRHHIISYQRTVGTLAQSWCTTAEVETPLSVARAAMKTRRGARNSRVLPPCRRAVIQVQFAPCSVSPPASSAASLRSVGDSREAPVSHSTGPVLRLQRVQNLIGNRVQARRKGPPLRVGHHFVRPDRVVLRPQAARIAAPPAAHPHCSGK